MAAGLIAVCPLGLAVIALLRTSGLAPQTAWPGVGLCVAWMIGSVLIIRSRVVRPLQTLANLLAALRDGDVSTKARGARSDDALGLVMLEINALSESLRSQRVGAAEATALLKSVMAEIDVAVLAFDADRRLKLVNRAGERLLGQPGSTMLGGHAADLDLEGLLEGETPRTVASDFAGGPGRWELRRTTFRQDGLPHQLIVLSDLSRALREEERQAWQRLIRVLTHEINNSLTPIQSIAGSLLDSSRGDPLADDFQEDLDKGLTVIQGRSAGLSRFMASYARLAHLPPPNRAVLSVTDWVMRAATLERRLQVMIRGGPAISIDADADQLDQLLINLIRNAVDASLETGGTVEVSWKITGMTLELSVVDDGPGLSDTANLFVPFFTTKPRGSGIGLVLSRQIAEAHGGELSLENRANGASGCVAVVRLPF